MRNVIERYFVDEEKKVVVCKLEMCAEELICDMCHKNWPGDVNLLINDTYTGKAKCSSDDTFDVELGKKIAFKRAVAKLNTAKRKTLARFVANFTKIQKDLERDSASLIAKYENTANRQVESIAHMLSGDTNNQNKEVQ